MKGKWIIAVTVVAAIIAMTVVAAHASMFDEPQGKRRPRMRERMQERVELMMMWRLTSALDLDEETAAKLFPLLHESNVQQRKLHDSRREIIQQMKAEIAEEKPDSASLTALIERFKQNERDLVDMRNKKIDDLSKLLTEEQTAQVIILVPQFMRDVKELASEVRGRHRRGEGMFDRGREQGPPDPPGFTPYD